MEKRTDPDVAREAGRGVLWIALAKGWFMVAGYAIEFALPHLLSAALFGIWKIVIGMVSVLNNTMVTATIQTVSKFVSERERDSGVSRAALRMQCVLGSVLALAYLLSAPWIAQFERDAALIPYLRGTAVIVFCYALYAVFVGVANGLRRFHVQAALDMTFSTTKAALVIGAAALGFGVGGAVGGFVVTAVTILCIAFFWVGVERAADPPPMRRLLSFFAQMVVYTLLLNLLLLVDLFLLKRLAAEASGLAGAFAAEHASRIAAYYAAAQTLARIPYQGILAVAFVVFPLVSRATFVNDRAATSATVRATLRFSLLGAAALAAVFEANPTAVLHLVYPAEYGQGALALSLLAPAQVLFSVFAIACTVLNAAGLTRVSLQSVSVALLALVATCIAMPQWLAGSLDVSTTTALAVLGANALGCGLALSALSRHVGASLPLLCAVRAGLAFVIATVVGHMMPDGSKAATLAECAVVFGTYVGSLVVLREFDRSDLARVKQIFARVGSHR